MKKQDLETRLILFASAVIDLSESFEGSFANNHLRKQLIRSTTSAALNYGEAQAGESRADFIHKMKVALKELKESFVCIKLLMNRQSLSTVNFSLIHKENNELIAIFTSSVKTASIGSRKV